MFYFHFTPNGLFDSVIPESIHYSVQNGDVLGDVLRPP